jgi:hypothetical protein
MGRGTRPILLVGGVLAEAIAFASVIDLIKAPVFVRLKIA